MCGELSLNQLEIQHDVLLYRLFPQLAVEDSERAKHFRDKIDADLDAGRNVSLRDASLAMTQEERIRTSLALGIAYSDL